MPWIHLPEQDRPREKLLHKGASSLTDAELLAILLRTGIKDKPVMQLSLELVQTFGSIRALLSADIHKLMTTQGLGTAKAASLLCIRELSRRMAIENLREGSCVQSPQAAKDLMRIELGSLPHEVFSVVYLDARNRYLQHENLFRGTLTQTTVYPREVIKNALKINAGAVIIAHNHPSGFAEPSQADHQMTEKLRAALALVDIQLLDHLLIAGSKAVSFAENGWL